jgi:hypothetical protein
MVKQGCPLSLTLFGIYVDELQTFFREHIHDGDNGPGADYLLVFVVDFALGEAVDFPLSCALEGL